jgi:hypothetical protein
LGRETHLAVAASEPMNTSLFHVLNLFNTFYSTLRYLIRAKRLVQERNAAESSQRQSVPADPARLVSKRPSARLILARSANPI